MNVRSLSSLLAIAPLTLSLGAVGCSQEADDVGDDEEAIVGAEDLKTLEKELSLTRDVKDKKGNYARSNATIKTGACYTKTRGGKDGASYEILRYTNATAVLKKQGSGLSSGEARPVLCMDLDLDIGGTNVPQYVGRAQLDTIVRFHLGRIGQISDRADGKTSTVAFERGSYIVALEQSPGADSLDNPSWRSRALLGITTSGSKKVIDPTLVSLAYRYAWNSAVGRDQFDAASDPVGKFLSVEVDAQKNEHLHFERVDVHRVVTGEGGSSGVDTITITPKSVGNLKNPDQTIASCERALDEDGDPTEKFDCTGLGTPNPISTKTSEAKIDPNAATSKIVVAKSVRGIKLNMTKEQVIAILGPADKAQSWYNEITFVTDLHYGLTEVQIDGNGLVFDVSTTSPKVRTAKGLGVGTAATEVEAAFPNGDCDKAGFKLTGIYGSSCWTHGYAGIEGPGGADDRQWSAFDLFHGKVTGYRLFTRED